MNIYKGDLVFTEKKDTFSVIQDGFIGVDHGVIQFVSDKIPDKYRNQPITDYTGKLIMPSFSDLHTHAPQFANMGLGMDMELLDWLKTYTFPEEAKYDDLSYAKKMYQFVVNKLISSGTTRAVFFATIHKESTELLMDLVEESGMCAYVGKVNMDRNSPDILIEGTEQSLQDTIAWVENTIEKYQHVKPIITPRFVPTCTTELMTGLTQIADKYNLAIQSHLSENKGEIAWVEELYPDEKSYAHVYDTLGQLNDRTLMAHCVHLKDIEVDLLKETGTIVVHCPTSNANLSSGIIPLTTLLDEGVSIGLGTDVSGGHTPSMQRVMVSAIHLSKMHYERTGSKILTEENAFYLATKASGSYFGKVGSFEVGYDFDAIVVEDRFISANENLNLKQRMQRFIYNGDDRNIEHVYCMGTKIK